MSLRKEFFHLQMKNNKNMSAYIQRAEIEANNLREAEGEAKDEDLAYALLAEHPQSYESLNMSLASLSNEKSTKFWGNYNDSTREYDRRRTRQANEANIYKEALHMIKKSNRRPNTEMTKYKTKKITL